MFLWGGVLIFWYMYIMGIGNRIGQMRVMNMSVTSNICHSFALGTFKTLPPSYFKIHS